MLFQTDDGVIYNLNHKNLTAQLIHSTNESDIFIPKSIVYLSKEYIITDIDYFRHYSSPECMIKGNDMVPPLNFTGQNKLCKSLSFSDDSELICIHSNSFKCSVIESLSIPASLDYLEEGWCNEAKKLYYIKISPGNKNYMYIDNKMIIGKSDTTSDIYDILSFVRRDAKDIKIPSFIKYIHSSAFDSCISLVSIEIPDDSELFSIGSCAFANCPIKKFVIPSKLQILDCGWCEDLTDLEEIIVSPENKFFSTIYNKTCLVGKTNSNIKNYYILYYVARNIEKIKIPSYIKLIRSYSFQNTKKIKFFEFESDSQLVRIEDYSFYASSIQEITIPKSVRSICADAFVSSDLDILKFSPDSKLEFIGHHALEGANIVDISIPESVKRIDYSAFCFCESLKSIEFMSQAITIGKYCFGCCPSLFLISLPNIKYFCIHEEIFSELLDFSLFICPYTVILEKQE